MENQNRVELPKGTCVGPFEITGILGKGGFAITYLAKHRGLNRLIALKELFPVDLAERPRGLQIVPLPAPPDYDFNWAKARFIDEAQQLAMFNHPNIVSVHDIFQANGTAYMATSYKEGQDLRRWRTKGGEIQSADDVNSILFPVMDGLEAVHLTGLLHRDIKPSNIYRCEDGTPILLDFGSARQVVGKQSRPMTTLVTSGYAPFEQYHSEGSEGPWTDIYALAAVAYFLITGEKPPDSVDRVNHDGCQKLSSYSSPAFSTQFMGAIDWGLAVLESERPQSISSWKSRFETSQTSPNPTPEPPVEDYETQSRGVGLTMIGADVQGNSFKIFLPYADLVSYPGGFVIGRHSELANFVLPNTSVSKAHARLSYDSSNDRLMVEDLDSSNGTRLNEKKIRKRSVVSDGSELRFGEVKFSVFITRPVLPPPLPENRGGYTNNASANYPPQSYTPPPAQPEYNPQPQPQPAPHQWSQNPAPRPGTQPSYSNRNTRRKSPVPMIAMVGIAILFFLIITLIIVGISSG